MPEESVLTRLRKMDEMLAVAEVNLRGARMQMDAIADSLGFARAHRPDLADENHNGERVPYPQLTQEALSHSTDTHSGL